MILKLCPKCEKVMIPSIETWLHYECSYCGFDERNTWNTILSTNTKLSDEEIKILKENGVIKDAKKMFKDVNYNISEQEEHLLRYSNGYFYIDFYLKIHEYYTEDKSDKVLLAIQQQLRELGW